MDIETSIAGVRKERGALQQKEGLSNPSYISEHMQALSQYVSSLDDAVREEETRLEIQESRLYKKYRLEGMSVNATEKTIKYEMMEDRAELSSHNRLVGGSWKFINACQSRLKHLVEEAKSTI